MGPHEDTETRRCTDDYGRASSAGDEPDGWATGTASDGGSDDRPAPWRIRVDERNDWLDTRRRERRRERERRWEQLQLVT